MRLYDFSGKILEGYASDVLNEKLIEKGCRGPCWAIRTEQIDRYTSKERVQWNYITRRDVKKMQSRGLNPIKVYL